MSKLDDDFHHEATPVVVIFFFFISLASALVCIFMELYTG